MNDNADINSTSLTQTIRQHLLQLFILLVKIDTTGPYIACTTASSRLMMIV